MPVIDEPVVLESLDWADRLRPMAMNRPKPEDQYEIVTKRSSLRSVGNEDGRARVEILLVRRHFGDWRRAWLKAYPGERIERELLIEMIGRTATLADQAPPDLWAAGSWLLSILSKMIESAVYYRSLPPGIRGDDSGRVLCDLLERGCLPLGITDEKRFIVFSPNERLRAKWDKQQAKGQ